MSLQSPEIRAVLARVEKLEEANAQLKRVGGVVLLIAVATLLMGQTKQGATPWQKQVLRIGTVQANTIEVLPERISVVKGFSPVPAVRIRGSSLGSELTMFDENGKARVSLNGSMGLLQMGELETDSLGYVSPLQGNTVSLSASGNGGTLTLNDRSGEQTIHLSARPADAATGSEGGVILNLISDAPRLTLGKLDGYRTVIGSEELASAGKTYRTSAASVVLVNEKDSVIWSAERAREQALAVDYLKTEVEDLQSRLLNADHLQREFGEFKDAACPVLRETDVARQIKVKLDSACGTR